nr:DUF6193 family natural product biosynthesis protein [Kitasatospora sp. SID7827]
MHWRLRLQGLGHGRHPGPDRVLELWRAAFAEPRLRRLYPISSHHNLWFSTGLGPPYESVGLLIVPHSDGTYEVRYHRGSSAVAEALPEPVAVATAAEAVAVAVAALPPQAP